MLGAKASEREACGVKLAVPFEIRLMFSFLYDSDLL